MATKLRFPRLRQKQLILVFLFLVTIGWTCFYLGTTVTTRSRIIKKLTTQIGWEDVYSFRLPSPEFHDPSEDLDLKSKWIIVTAKELLPLDHVRSVLAWTVLIVCDMDPPSNWSHPNIELLTLDKQMSLGYRVSSFLSTSSHLQKVIGYLYAIERGAKYIYDGNTLEDFKIIDQSLTFGKTTRGLILANLTSSVINPYAYFSQTGIWPRGFPYDNIDQSETIPFPFAACQMKTPIIQHMIQTSNLDLDLNSNLQSRSNVEFDRIAPPLILPKFVFAPFNSKSTLFHYEAFWALLFPATVLEEDADIYRAYWAQQLLWTMGSNLGFSLQSSSSKGSTSEINSTTISMNDRIKESEDRFNLLISTLRTWSCTKTDLYACMESLTKFLVQSLLWSQKEVDVLQAWILDLKSVGYKVPVLQRNSNPDTPCLPEKTQSVGRIHTKPQDIQKSDASRTHLRHFCNFTIEEGIPDTQYKMNWTGNSNFSTTLLVITYNYPHYDNIWILDLIYRPHFPNILYCGPLDNPDILTEILSRDKFKETNTDKISFIKGPSMAADDGCFNYECAMRAIDMKYNVDGYLVIQDDVLLNLWNIGKYDRSEAWLQKGTMKRVNTELPASSVNWSWWRSQFGHGVVKQALNEIYNSTTSSPVKLFRSNRDVFGINSSTAFYSESEMFYIPASKQDMFYEVGSIFRHFEVYLEIAVPLIATGLSHPKKLVTMPGKDLWGDARNRSFQFFNVEKDWIHPLKPGDLIRNQTLKDNYCDQYVRRLLA